MPNNKSVLEIPDGVYRIDYTANIIDGLYRQFRKVEKLRNVSFRPISVENSLSGIFEYYGKVDTVTEN